MLTDFSIKNFRGIQTLKIEGFSRINLFVGRNNSGKTTVLEGIFLLGGATNPYQPTILGQLRGIRLGRNYPDPLWRPLFFRLQPRTPIELAAHWGNDSRPRSLTIEALQVTRYADLEDMGDPSGGVAAITDDFDIGGLELRYQPSFGEEVRTRSFYDPRSGNIDAQSKDRDDFFRTTFLSARAYSSLIRDAQQYSFLLRIKQEHDILRAVKIIEPSIQRIEVLSEPSGPGVYVDVGLESLVPLATCGDGFVRLFSIAVELTASRGGILLVDELDNGLHYSVLPELWKLLGDLSNQHDVQIFATTHNDELLSTAIEAFEDQPEMLGLYSVDRRDGKNFISRYDSEAQQAILSTNFEVRG